MSSYESPDSQDGDPRQDDTFLPETPSRGGQHRGSPLDRLRPAASDLVEDEVEEDAWQGGYSGKAMTGNWIVTGLVTIVVCLLLLLRAEWRSGNAGMFILLTLGLTWIGQGLLLIYRKLNVRFHLTTQRFIHRSGIVTHVSDRIEVIDIDDVTYYQGLVERMLNVGSIKLESSDRTHPELWLRGIDNVGEVADLFDDLRRKERRRRGVHIESI